MRPTVIAMNTKKSNLAPVGLDDALDSARYGHKAATLAALRRGGHNVPDGFVIPVGMSWDREALLAPLAALGSGPYALVRWRGLHTGR
jgi:hypothetical protein